MTFMIDRAGDFRGEILQFGLQEYDSGAVAIDITARILDAWDREAGEWEDWRQYDCQALGRLFVVKKNGSLNDGPIKSLVAFAGWDGNLESIVNGTWQPTPCAFTIEEDIYKTETRYRIGFVNDYNRTPGGQGNVDAEKAKAIQAKYGSQIRAIAGNVARTSTDAKPTGKPKAPPRKPPANVKSFTQEEMDAAAVEADSSIPF